MKQTLEDYAASTGKSWRTMLQALGIAERLLLIPQSGILTLALPENQDTGTTLELYEKPLAGVHCRILSEANIARLGETPPPWTITTSVDVKSNALPVVCPLDTLAHGPSTGLCFGVFVSFGLDDLWVEDEPEYANDEDEDEPEYANDEDEDTTIETPLHRKKLQQKYRIMLFDLVLEDWKQNLWGYGLAGRIRDRLDEIESDTVDKRQNLIYETYPILEFRKNDGKRQPLYNLGRSLQDIKKALVSNGDVPAEALEKKFTECLTKF